MAFETTTRRSNKQKKSIVGIITLSCEFDGKSWLLGSDVSFECLGPSVLQSLARRAFVRHASIEYRCPSVQQSLEQRSLVSSMVKVGFFDLMFLLCALALRFFNRWRDPRL